MSAEQPDSGDEPWLSREELVEREHQDWLRRCAELQRRIDERCRLAEARWRAAPRWLGEPGLCRTVPVRVLFLPTPDL
jgi:hypothetical protein